MEGCEHHFYRFSDPISVGFRFISAGNQTKRAVLNFESLGNNCLSKRFCKFQILARSDILTVELENYTDPLELKIHFFACKQCKADLKSQKFSKSEEYILEIPTCDPPIIDFK